MRNAEPVLPAAVAGSLDKPSAARLYDYWLGGSNNYAVDREYSRNVLEPITADVRIYAQENRKALRRAVRYAMDQGIRQFVDLGCGLPTAGHVHEVADEHTPGAARVVYVDNEPIAAAHAEILLDARADSGRHRALYGDILDRDKLWERVLATRVIKQQPICLLLVAVLHFIKDDRDPCDLVGFYRRALPSGSLLVMSHFTDTGIATPEEAANQRRLVDAYERTTNPGQTRTRDEFTEFFGGLEIVAPGIVYAPEWHPDPEDEPEWEGPPSRSRILFGVGRKP
ncbi:SAM-dependent methyltransferase [Amycolatopsis anabasis]|uniref:SAM-dependent methyltransferase n=1 Tax=Amycolatopsis anabasis TaxID=1840409 RepID=UPI00131D6D7C|nr:SAM-dependent methyltransferase [Amycolatopsis anabasis]